MGRSLLLTAWVLSAACGRSDAELPRGSNGAACYPNGTCDVGWFCNRDFACVQASEDWCAFAGSELTFNGVSHLAGPRLRIVNGGLNENNSAFCSDRVIITAFATEFSVYIPVAEADGMTFAVQNEGPLAVGDHGGGLGYGPDPDNLPDTEPRIDWSVAVKLDIYDNVGEGSSSTGVYLNGAAPGVPASDLLTAGIDLSSGNLVRVRVESEAGVLTVTITDQITGATFREAYDVDLPGTVADNRAYVGFTGATGGRPAVIEVFDWTFGSL